MEIIEGGTGKVLFSVVAPAFRFHTTDFMNLAQSAFWHILNGQKHAAINGGVRTDYILRVQPE